MNKDAAITVRLPADLKRRLARRAKRERRSVSAQVQIELERALALESDAASEQIAALGRYSGMRLPSEADLVEVRSMLWGGLGR
jgi:plasmid stability protein